MGARWKGVLLAIGGLTLGALASQPRPTTPTDAEVALQTLNSLRKEMGLEPAKVNGALMNSAQAHAKYMFENGQPTHVQSADKPGFVGVDPTARAKAFGYEGLVAECVGKSEREPAEIVSKYFAAPYHRLPLIRPGAIDFGAGFAGPYSCLNFGIQGDRGTIISPSDGQTNIPLDWDGIETPNPLRVHQAEAPVGYPIVVAYFGRGPGKIVAETAKLETGSGDAVPIYLSHPGNDPELRNAMFLIPKQPLQPKTRYFATAQFKAPDGKMIEVSAGFTTADR